MLPVSEKRGWKDWELKGGGHPRRRLDVRYEKQHRLPWHATPFTLSHTGLFARLAINTYNP